MSATTAPAPLSSTVRDRIMATAFDLFYRQGYRATGINQIITESGVAKATFYAHFPSKEALLHKYLEEVAGKEYEEVSAKVRALPTARDRFFGVFGVLAPWFEDTDFRGCPFINILAESPHEDKVVRHMAVVHRENVRRLVEEITAELFAEIPDLSRLDQTEVVELYMLLFEGAISLSVAYRSTWPVTAAECHMEKWLGLD